MMSVRDAALLLLKLTRLFFRLARRSSQKRKLHRQIKPALLYLYVIVDGLLREIRKCRHRRRVVNIQTLFHDTDDLRVLLRREIKPIPSHLDERFDSLRTGSLGGR